MYSTHRKKLFFSRKNILTRFLSKQHTHFPVSFISYIHPFVCFYIERPPSLTNLTSTKSLTNISIQKKFFSFQNFVFSPSLFLSTFHQIWWTYKFSSTFEVLVIFSPNLHKHQPMYAFCTKVECKPLASIL